MWRATYALHQQCQYRVVATAMARCLHKRQGFFDFWHDERSKTGHHPSNWEGIFMLERSSTDVVRTFRTECRYLSTLDSKRRFDFLRRALLEVHIIMTYMILSTASCFKREKAYRYFLPVEKACLASRSKRRRQRLSKEVWPFTFLLVYQIQGR